MMNQREGRSYYFTLASWLMVFALIAAPASSLANSSVDSSQDSPNTPAKTSDASTSHPPITIGQSIILGVIEGLTEYLPVSSTGHLVLASEFMDMGGYQKTPDGEIVHGPLGPKMQENKGLNAFNIVIQLGAILAVVGLYRKTIGRMGQGLLGHDPRGRRIFFLLVTAFAPAAILGPLLDDMIEEYLFSPFTVAGALLVGGVIMIVIEWWYEKTLTDKKRVHKLYYVTYRQALLVGLAQCLAMWPGTSRSMVTILAALLVGMDLLVAAEFSFLLALPTLGGATVYKAMTQWDSLQTAAGVDSILIGLIVSGIVAAIAVAGFVKWLTRHGLMPFGVYRILLAIAVLVWFCSNG